MPHPAPPPAPILSPAEMERLVVENVALAHYLARPWVRALGESHAEDLAAAGVAGLVEAARRFDPARSSKFGSYASFYIRMQLRDYTRRAKGAVLAPNSGHAAQHRREIMKAQVALSQALEREPTSDEIAAKTKLKPEYVRYMLVRATTRDASIAHHDVEEGMYQASVEGDQEERVGSALRDASITQAVERALRSLDARERAVIRGRYLEAEPMTHAALGAVFGISKQRAQQIEIRAMQKLRTALASRRGELLED